MVLPPLELDSRYFSSLAVWWRYNPRLASSRQDGWGWIRQAGAGSSRLHRDLPWAHHHGKSGPKMLYRRLTPPSGKALARMTITLILDGRLTIDRGRAKSHARARRAIVKLLKAGKPVPEELTQNLDRWSEKRFFWIPVDAQGHGSIVEMLEDETAYDLGRRGNWRQVMGPGWKWLWPPNVLLRRVGMNEGIYNWPIAADVEKRLREAALRTIGTGDAMHGK